MRDEVGTLGSGNHYLEVQAVEEVHDERTAEVFGLASGDVVVSIHCGSRGLGHQIGTEALREMLDAGRRHGLLGDHRPGRHDRDAALGRCVERPRRARRGDRRAGPALVPGRRDHRRRTARASSGPGR